MTHPDLNLRAITATITELPGITGWGLQLDGGPTTIWPTAVDAHAALSRELQQLADSGCSTVCRLIWYPSSAIGRSIVKVLTAK